MPDYFNQLIDSRILVTGASGFLGRAVAMAFLERFDSKLVNLAFRRAEVHNEFQGHNCYEVGEIDDSTNWLKALMNVSIVVHCAARVHVMKEKSSDSLSEYRRVNVAGTMNLAHQAKQAGVKRFIFISTIKVNGGSTDDGITFNENQKAVSMDPYGQSKLEAENALQKFGLSSGMEIVIIRPPLIYGPGVKANFASMMRWLKRGLPLPLGAIYNRRSLVSLGNLVDLILICLTHTAAANQTFMVSDGEDVSTTELLRRMGLAMGHPARLIPVPASLVKAVAGLLGRADIAQRLCGSLHVDISKTQELLGWSPPLTLDEGLALAAIEFKS